MLKCKHPFSQLQVEDDSTKERVDDDFTRVIHHLRCGKCRKSLDLSYAKLTHGVRAFLGT